jgi:hypothetical protein
MHDLLKAAIEQHLSELTDVEFAALIARVRPPGPNSAQSADQLGADGVPNQQEVTS